MAVLLETSKGDIVIDLLVDDCPVACKNFLKLCKIKYYNNCIFHNVQRNFLVQTGDPTATGKGGSSIYGLMYGEQARCFEDEIRPNLKHRVKGVVGMASPLPNANASQFYLTTGDSLTSLDGKHTIFGQIAEGQEVLDKINEAFCDPAGRPYQNIRIRHTIILDDPFDDPPELGALIPDRSPEPQFEQGDRLEDDWVPAEDTRNAEELEEETRKADAHNRAVVLEMIGDLPEADAKPPSNVLFVCKLNQATTEEDLEIIFSRFGHVTDCSIIRDWKTGDSLCYAFIGFDSESSCEEAYFKMNNVLIDDRRIKVDFSQSVAHLWKQFKKGGRKGDAAMMKEADMHERQGRGRIEIKGQGGGYGGGGGRGGGRGGRGGGQQYGLLMDDDEGGMGPGPGPAPGRGPPPDAARGRGGRSPPMPAERPPPGMGGGRQDRNERGGGGRARSRSRSRSRGRGREGEREVRDGRDGREGGGRGDKGRARSRSRSRERDRDARDRGREGRDREQPRERDGGKDREREKERERRRSRSREGRDRERERERERDRPRDKDRDAGGRERDRERDRDRDRRR